MDLGDVSDEEEITDITQKKILEKTIPCPSCDVMFATNMSLKMHLNLQHPVKAEVSVERSLQGFNRNYINRLQIIRSNFLVRRRTTLMKGTRRSGTK